MPKRALLERRPWLLASLAFAIAYYLLLQGETAETYLLLLKGGALGLLAIYALLRHMGRDTQMLAMMMLFAAFGAMVFDLFFQQGVFLLVISLGIGVALFARYPREAPTASQRATAVALLFLTPAIAWLLTADSRDAWTIVVYAFVLGGMAASAWMSAFPRYRVGAGAVALVAAALIGLAGQSRPLPPALPALLTWPLYYIGYLLICTGAIQTLRSGGPR